MDKRFTNNPDNKNDNNNNNNNNSFTIQDDNFHSIRAYDEQGYSR